jgi:hypothetical protein
MIELQFNDYQLANLRWLLRAIGTTELNTGDWVHEILGTLDQLELGQPNLDPEMTAALLQARMADHAAAEKLEFIRNKWSPFGARSCPACVYEDGVFKRSCRIHLRLDVCEKLLEDFNNAIEAVYLAAGVSYQESVGDAVAALVAQRDAARDAGAEAVAVWLERDDHQVMPDMLKQLAMHIRNGVHKLGSK